MRDDPRLAERIDKPVSKVTRPLRSTSRDNECVMGGKRRPQRLRDRGGIVGQGRQQSWITAIFDEGGGNGRSVAIVDPCRP